MVVTVLNVKDGRRAGEEVEEVEEEEGVVEVFFFNFDMPQTKFFSSLGGFMSLSRFKVILNVQ